MVLTFEPYDYRRIAGCLHVGPRASVGVNTLPLVGGNAGDLTRNAFETAGVATLALERWGMKNGRLDF